MYNVVTFVFYCHCVTLCNIAVTYIMLLCVISCYCVLYYCFTWCNGYLESCYCVTFRNVGDILCKSNTFLVIIEISSCGQLSSCAHLSVLLTGTESAVIMFNLLNTNARRST